MLFPLVKFHLRTRIERYFDVHSCDTYIVQGYVLCWFQTKFALYWYQHLLPLRKGTQTLPLGHWLQRFFSLRNRCAAYLLLFDLDDITLHYFSILFIQRTSTLDMPIHAMHGLQGQSNLELQLVQVNDDSIPTISPKESSWRICEYLQIPWELFVAHTLCGSWACFLTLLSLIQTSLVPFHPCPPVRQFWNYSVSPRTGKKKQGSISVHRSKKKSRSAFQSWFWTLTFWIGDKIFVIGFCCQTCMNVKQF